MLDSGWRTTSRTLSHGMKRTPFPASDAGYNLASFMNKRQISKLRYLNYEYLQYDKCVDYLV